MKNFTEVLTSMIASITDQVKFSNSSIDKKYLNNSRDPTTLVPDNKKAPPLECGHSTKIGGMCILKHDIISPKFYEILIKTELKGYTTLDLNSFYRNIKMCLTAVDRLR